MQYVKMLMVYFIIEIYLNITLVQVNYFKMPLINYVCLFL